MKRELGALSGASKKMDSITNFWKIFLDASVFGYILAAIISAVFPTFH